MLVWLSCTLIEASLRSHLFPPFPFLKNKSTTCTAQIEMAGVITMKKQTSLRGVIAATYMEMYKNLLNKNLLKTQFSAGTGPRMTAAYI